MNDNAQAIDRIVAEVVRRLTQLAESPGGGPPASTTSAATTPATPTSNAPSSAAPATAAPVPPPPPDQLVLDARVVTTATVYGRLQGVRQVIVEPRAVVTPSVRDELDKKGIRLERRAATSATAAVADVTVVRCVKSQDAARASATLPLPAAAVEHVSDDLKDAVAAAGQAVQDRESVALVLTDETLAAACLLNRASHVRAAHGRTIDDVRQAIGALGANVLVLDPRDMTVNQWSVAVKVFRSDLPRGCPPMLQ